MQNSNLYLPGFHLATLRRRPRSAAQKLADEKARIRQQSISQLGDCFGHFIPAKALENRLDGAFSRRRLFSKENTFWAFFSQILEADGGCQEVVRKVQACQSIPLQRKAGVVWVSSRLLHQLFGKLGVVFGDALRPLRPLCIDKPDKRIQIKGITNFLAISSNALTQLEKSVAGHDHRILTPFNSAIESLDSRSCASGTHCLFSTRNGKSRWRAGRIVTINRLSSSLIGQFLKSFLFLLILLGQITLALFKLVIGLGQVASSARRNECCNTG